MLAALVESSLDLEIILNRRTADGWLREPRSPIKRLGVDGPLFGEVVVFTGALDMPRREAAEMAAAVGCEVAPSVTRRTTLLVVGDLDVRTLAGHEKSAKHRKAQKLITEGVPIRIICETDFYELTSNNHQKPNND
jgi:DNA polymerase III subunit epsilon